MTIKILLADDHRLISEGLRSLIHEQEDMCVVATAEDGRSAVRLADKYKPDLIIMDVAMPGLNGIEATRQILTASGRSKVLALSMHLNRRTVLDMLEAGASGYLLKDCMLEELIQAIKDVMADRTYLSPQVSGLIMKDFIHKLPKDDKSPFTILTSREREVLQLLAEGKKMKDIASALHVTPKTAEYHRKRIMEKLNLYSIAELTKLAVREGLTPP